LADDVQAVSVDEAIIDVTNTVEEFKTVFMLNHPEVSVTDLASHDFAKEYAESLRKQVREITGCESEYFISTIADALIPVQLV
jgi:DNA repair protein REV1